MYWRVFVDLNQWRSRIVCRLGFVPRPTYGYGLGGLLYLREESHQQSKGSKQQTK